MTKVTIVGVGALGSHLAQFLRSEDVSMTLIDFDRVEAKNVKSQFHGAKSRGKNKAQGLVQTMQFFYGIKTKGIPHKLTEDNADQLLGGADLVVDCLDNGAARRVVQGYIRAQGIPCVHGALSADGTFGQVVWDSKFSVDDEDKEGQATCENGEHLPFIAMASAALARSIQAYLKDGTEKSFSVFSSGIRPL